MSSLQARSISRPVQVLRQGCSIEHPFVGRVLGVFDHACDLVTPDGDVIALVTPDVSDGPLNIVVDAEPGDFATLWPGLAATVQEASLHIGQLQVDWLGARIWEPCPDWDTLRCYQNNVASRLRLLQARAGQVQQPTRLPDSFEPAPGCGSASDKVGHLFTQRNCTAAWMAGLRQAALDLRAGWDGDLARLQEGATRLAGLGSGLTPAGDDFLIGVMLWAWLAHSAPCDFCRTIIEAAAPRTTLLSAAFLRSAARGECSAAWHRWLTVLASGPDDELDAATRLVLSYGATSGADTLAGLLWMADIRRQLANQLWNFIISPMSPTTLILPDMKALTAFSSPRATAK